MKVLYVHGWNSVVGGVKPTYLKSYGHEVVEPALDHEDFQAALRAAQAAFYQHQPDVVVGSSRRGAVAVNLNSGDARFVLICPAWKKWGAAKTVKPGTLILHSRADDVVPFQDSVELLANSGLPESSLIEVGTDQRIGRPMALWQATAEPAAATLTVAAPWQAGETLARRSRGVAICGMRCPSVRHPAGSHRVGLDAYGTATQPRNIKARSASDGSRPPHRKPFRTEHRSTRHASS
ncbi:MAG: hypothetical protein WCC69_03915 [Pirellulales bacterium]